MLCDGTGKLERSYCTLAELGPAEVVPCLLGGATTHPSLHKVPGNVAHNRAPLSCATLAEVCAEEGQQEASKSARQARLQRGQEHEQQHLNAVARLIRCPFLVFEALVHLLCTASDVLWGVGTRFVTVVRANRCSSQGNTTFLL